MSGSGESPPLGCRLSTSCILTWQKESELALSPLLIRGLIPLMRNHIQRLHLQYHHTGTRVLAYGFGWGGGNIQTITITEKQGTGLALGDTIEIDHG